VTVRQFPQPGDVVAKRVQDQGGADDLHGAVLVARRDEPSQSHATDLSNVIPFTRARRQGTVTPFPLPSVAADERPAPRAAKFGIGRSLALIVGSLVLHSAMLAMFWHQPRPMASIGVEVMTIEITLGAVTPAGLAPTPGEQEAQAAPQSENPAQEEPVTEQSRVATVMPQEVPVAAVETAPDVKPEEVRPEEQAVDPKPQEQRPEATLAESPAVTQPTERTEQPRPQVQAVQKAPERRRIEAPTDKKAAQKKQRAAAVASDAASGIGRGRSDRDANYPGRVHAHLARYKQYPAGARSAGAQGTAAVAFSLDGGGRVTSVRLARSSGNPAIDQEVVAMVRRASPFPAPPEGKGQNFNVSVPFVLR
jgi:periplasmic protein TonB